MAKINYTCKNCSNVFIGSEYTDQCYNCNSSNIEAEQKTKVTIPTGGLKNVKIYLIIAAIIVVLLIFFIGCPGCKDGSGTKYEMKVTQTSPSNPFLEIELWSYKSNDSLKKTPVAYTEVDKILHDFVLIGGKRIRIQDENRIYLCKNYNGNFTINGLSNYDDTKELKCITAFELNGIAESSKAECPLVLDATQINVSSTNDCKLVVSVNQDLKGQELLISVTGPDGPFEKKKIWDRKNLNILDVYVYLVGEEKANAVAYLQNGSQLYTAGCVPIDPEEIIKNFSSNLGGFCINPKDRAAQKAFQAYMNAHSTNPVIKLNGKNVDIAEFQTEIRINSQSGIRYKLVGKPQVSESGIITSFEVKEE
jgi:hypothetical protein